MEAKTAKAWTLTFYAYKGGTGRTLALTNVARYMAEELGYRIGVVDLDLESPGLSHEPLCSDLEIQSKKRKTRSREIDNHLGFADLINALAAEQAAVTQMADSKLDRYVIPLESKGDGSIVFMPTAKGSVSKSRHYVESLERFLRYLAKTDDEEVARLTQAVLEAFIRRYNLDFLFLDGRTGTGSFFPIYTYAVPQLLILFFGLNEQNISGSLSVLQAQTEDAVEEAPVLLIASPVPTVGPEMLESRLRAVEMELERLRQHRINNVLDSNRYIYELPLSVSFMLPYSDLASYGEVYFPSCFPHSLLAREYRRLANAIQAMVLKQPPTARAEERFEIHKNQIKAWSAGRVEKKPFLRIAAENITYDHFRTFFEEQYGYSSNQFELSNLTDDARSLSVCSNAGIDFQVELWPSEVKSAPWEVLVASRGLPDPPDVLLIPQIHLGPASQAQGKGGLLNLTEHRLSTRGTARPKIFEYRFLDRYYPGWRRWCSFGARVMGVPFSVNTMLFCANQELLPEVCRPYWEARGHTRVAPSATFLPSSWPSLLETLRQFNELAPTARSWYPFRMILHERGLYYEWLNIVVALGGVDLQEGEGRLLEGVNIRDDRVVVATELLRDLAAHTPMRQVRMDEQIEDFGQGKLALYVAWTDSFRFRRSSQGPVAEQGGGSLETSMVEVPGRLPPDDKLRIHLGQLPRDVNYPRKSVVDGWLMVFPDTGDPGRQSRAFDFASNFLNPEIQLALVRKGFPTANLWAIEKELEVHGEPSGRDRTLGERNYSVFLRALRAAIVEGHWVPSPEKGHEINALIQAALRKILAGEAPQVKLAEVQERINVMIPVTPTRQRE